jgi:hypothetical protein
MLWYANLAVQHRKYEQLNNVHDVEPVPYPILIASRSIFRHGLIFFTVFQVHVFQLFFSSTISVNSAYHNHMPTTSSRDPNHGGTSLHQHILHFRIFRTFP